MSRIRADIYPPIDSATGAIKLAIGPLYKITSLVYGMELDRIGTFSCTVPFTDERVKSIGFAYQLWFYHEGEGLVFKGEVTKIEIEASGDGNWQYAISGYSIAHHLVRRNCLVGKVYNSYLVGDFIDNILIGTGWTRGVSGTSGGIVLYMAPVGLSIWAAMVRGAAIFGHHIREDIWDRRIDVSSFGTIASPLLRSVEHASPALFDEPNKTWPITGIRLAYESTDIVNRVVPIGRANLKYTPAGSTQEKSDGAIDLRLNTAIAPLSYVGMDGKTYYYLEDTTSLLTYGVHEKVITLTDPTMQLDAASATMLARYAIEYLNRHKNPMEAYEVQVTGMPHISGTGPIFEVGDKMKVDFRGAVTMQDGNRVAYRTIQANLWLMGFTRQLNDSSSNWTLNLSTVERHPEDIIDQVIQQIEDINAVTIL